MSGEDCWGRRGIGFREIIAWIYFYIYIYIYFLFFLGGGHNPRKTAIPRKHVFRGARKSEVSSF